LGETFLCILRDDIQSISPFVFRRNYFIFKKRQEPRFSIISLYSTWYYYSLLFFIIKIHFIFGCLKLMLLLRLVKIRVTLWIRCNELFHESLFSGLSCLRLILYYCWIWWFCIFFILKDYHFCWHYQLLLFWSLNLYIFLYSNRLFL
jgi:hypothetical protein